MILEKCREKIEQLLEIDWKIWLSVFFSIGFAAGYWINLYILRIANANVVG